MVKRHLSLLSKSERNSVLLVALIFPFFGLFYSFLKRNETWFKNLLWIFVAYSGFVFIYNPIGGTSHDFIRYAEDFQNYAQSDLSFFGIIKNSFVVGGNRDIFMAILMFTVSRFTANPTIFFGVFALIYGFFYSRNIWYLFNNNNTSNQHSFYITILLLFFMLIVPFWGLVRIWFAIHVFFYGALPFVYKGDKSKLIWVFLTPLIHFSTMFPLSIFLIFLIFGAKQKVYFIFYIVTLFISEIDLDFVRNAVSDLFPYLQSTAEVYTSETYAEVVSSRTYVWHFKLATMLVKWYFIVMPIISYFYFTKYFKSNVALNRLFSFSFLLYGASNIFALIPSGGRYVFLSRLFMLFAIVLSFLSKNPPSNYKKYMPLSLMLFYPVIFNVRVGFDYYGLSLFIGNFLTTFFWTDNIPLIDFIK